MQDIIRNREATGRVAKWAVEIGVHNIKYEPRKVIKSQALADFIADWEEAQQPEKLPYLHYWSLHFDGSKNADGSVTIQKYYCADEGTRYIDFLRDYACSEHTKNGYDPTDAEVVEAFRKYICPCSIENHFVPDDWGDYYDKEKGTLKLRFIPLCEADVPTSRATADAFVKEFRRAYYGDGREDYDVYFERKVRDNGEIYIDNLRITSPSGIHLEYKAQ